jgi:hypothetical protein
MEWGSTTDRHAGREPKVAIALPVFWFMATELQSGELTGRTPFKTVTERHTKEALPEAQLQQTNHNCGYEQDKAEGAEGQRRRRALLPSNPAGEQSVPEVQACGRVGMEKGATGEPATPS